MFIVVLCKEAFVPENIIYYEQPLNEKIRTFMRLEHLFLQSEHDFMGDDIWQSRSAINTLIEILAIFNRADLKTDFIKELERHAKTLEKMEQNPAVDHNRLAELLREMNHLAQYFHDFNGSLCSQLKQDEFLNTITQRSSIPGGSCSFDIPEYHHWLKQPPELRYEITKKWYSVFETPKKTIMLLLNIMRNSSLPTQQTANNGFFQETLDPNLPCKIIRVAVPANLPFYAEISGGKHRFVIRFINSALSEQSGQTTNDIDFELTRCIL